MIDRIAFTLDDAAVEWHEYHLNDTPLLNDIYFRSWQTKLATILSPEQRAGKRCFICNSEVTEIAPGCVEYLGGYTIVSCPEPCEITMIEDDMEAMEENRAGVEPGRPRKRGRPKLSTSESYKRGRPKKDQSPSSS